MAKGALHIERNIVSSVISAMESAGAAPTEAYIRAKVKNMAYAHNYFGCLDAVVKHRHRVDV